MISKCIIPHDVSGNALDRNEVLVLCHDLYRKIQLNGWSYEVVFSPQIFNQAVLFASDFVNGAYIASQLAWAWKDTFNTLLAAYLSSHDMDCIM